MPEGPEIAVTAKYLKHNLLHAKIGKIKILSGRYTHENLVGLSLLDNRQDCYEVSDVCWKGKFLWIVLKKGTETIYLMSTFGMTGRWSFDKESNSRISLDICNTNNCLYFIDQRNFGTIIITKDKKILNAKINKLAMDLLQTDMNTNELADMIELYAKKLKTKQNIVKVLMDQDKGFGSGIGNYLSSEILYGAKISPRRNINDLTHSEYFALAKSIKKITKSAYGNNRIGYMTHFGSYIDEHILLAKNEFHRDIGPATKFKFKVYDQKTDPHGNSVVAEKINGDRTTFWVPVLQK